MALQSVPWAIGNGAHNQVEGARLSLYAATGGRGGVMSPTDMHVTALPVPGGAVRVHTGGAVIVSGYPGASSQAYAAREVSSTDVAIDTTGSSGSRTRYLVVRVHDHQYATESAPESVEHGPYNQYEWISQDPRTADLPYPVEGLAKVVQPANTGTITQDMIEDIRRLAQPFRSEVLFARPNIQGDTDKNLSDKTRGGEQFPGGAGAQGGYSHFEIDVPAEANRWIWEAQWMSLRSNGLSSWGTYWIEYGDERRPNGWDRPSPEGFDYEFRTQEFSWDVNETGFPHTVNWLLADHKHIPAKLRGKRVGVVFKARVNQAPSAKANAISATDLSGLMLRVTFAQAPEAEFGDPV